MDPPPNSLSAWLDEYCVQLTEAVQLSLKQAFLFSSLMNFTTSVKLSMRQFPSLRWEKQSSSLTRLLGEGGMCRS